MAFASSLMRRLGATLFAWFVLCGMGLAAPGVGEITLVIGQSELVRQSGQVVSAQKGLAIEEGDVIKTSVSGHVHVKFVDGALLSVRPDSVFTIREFKYNSADPASSTIRLVLDKGQARTVSGAGAQAAKERFRLNTPLVAIGVKGTDFTTQVGAQFTRVTVNQGAIVMAPFDQGCRAEALGVCQTDRAKDLSDAMAGMALIYRSGAASPALQPVAAASGAGNATASYWQLRDSLDRPVAPLAQPDTLVPETRLVWGRWAQSSLPGDQMTVSFRQAMQGNAVAVGDGYYFLFRERDVPNFLPLLNYRADFSLQASAAQYTTPANVVTPALVNSGTFSVDFAAHSYATQLQVQANGLSPLNLSYQGKVDAQTGIFLSPANTTGRLAGALSLTGNQAGYFFSAPAGLGSVSGATLWGRSP